MVHEINDSSFGSFVQDDSVAVIDFYAIWCPPCQKLSGVLDEISEEYKKGLTIGKINVDTNPGTAEKYGVMSTPTIMVFQNGQPVSTFVGYRPKQNLIDLLGLGTV